MERKSNPKRYQASKIITLEIKCENMNCNFNTSGFGFSMARHCNSPYGIVIGSDGKCKQFEDKNILKKEAVNLS